MPLEQGENSIRALATDTAGNLKSATIIVEAQTAEPVEELFFEDDDVMIGQYYITRFQLVMKGVMKAI